MVVMVVSIELLGDLILFIDFAVVFFLFGGLNEPLLAVCFCGAVVALGFG